MHIFFILIRYLKNGKITVLHEGQPININYQVFKILGSEDFPLLDYFKDFGILKRPTKYNTLFGNHHLTWIDREKLLASIPDPEIEQTLRFVEIMEEIFRLFIRDVEFGPNHKTKMQEFQAYVNTLSFSSIIEPCIEPRFDLGTSSTANVVKSFLFEGPTQLYDNGVKFNLSFLNQSHLEDIFEIIESLNRTKPNKVQFVNLLNTIINGPFTDVHCNRLFSTENYVF
jgi:hypothetical protein